jgi:ElaB/YqjD/DUF883 family membrane-anchored ribosome-binding protein
MTTQSKKSTQNEQSKERGSASARRGSARPDIVGDARRVADDATSMVRNAKRVGTDLRQIITERPLQAIGVAVGAGFLVGGGLSPAVLRSVTGIASRLAMVVLTRRIVTVLDQRGNGATQRGSRGTATQTDSEGED